jgi:putative flippase GtrA
VRFSQRREIFLVYVVSTVGLLINQLVLYLLVDRVGAELMPSKLTATVTVFFWNYWTRSNYVFGPPSVPNR